MVPAEGSGGAPGAPGMDLGGPGGCGRVRPDHPPFPGGSGTKPGGLERYRDTGGTAGDTGGAMSPGGPGWGWDLPFQLWLQALLWALLLGRLLRYGGGLGRGELPRDQAGTGAPQNRGGNPQSEP